MSIPLAMAIDDTAAAVFSVTSAESPGGHPSMDVDVFARSPGGGWIWIASGGGDWPLPELRRPTEDEIGGEHAILGLCGFSTPQGPEHASTYAYGVVAEAHTGIRLLRNGSPHEIIAEHCGAFVVQVEGTSPPEVVAVF